MLKFFHIIFNILKDYQIYIQENGNGIVTLIENDDLVELQNVTFTEEFRFVNYSIAIFAIIF